MNTNLKMGIWLWGWGVVALTMGNAQTVVFLQGAELSLTPGARMYIEGGIQLERESMVYNAGDLYVGTNGSGHVSTASNWINLNENLEGNAEGLPGTIHLIETELEQLITGTQASRFNQLRVIGGVKQEQDVTTSRLILEEGELNLNAHDLWIVDTQPLGIETRGDFHQIISETHPNRGGGYGNVYWNMAQAPAGSSYTIPFGTVGAKTKRGAMVPLEFELGSVGTGSFRAATYLTDILNNPYPINTGVGMDVTHMNGILGEDDGFSFVDRFWILDGGTNALSRLRLSYHEEGEGTGFTGNYPEKLRANLWEADTWSFPNLGERGDEAWVEINELPSATGVWGLSLIPGTVSLLDNLGVTEFQVSPNPTTHFSTLELTLETPQSIRVQLFDVQGKAVSEVWMPRQAYAYQHRVNLEDLSKGMYQLRIQLGEHMITRKLLKR